jgi:hypothetical protein
MTDALRAYSAASLSSLKRVNTHSYSLHSNHWALRSVAQSLGKPVWMSEVGCCIGAVNILGEKDDGTDIFSALWMADSVRLDLRDMKAEAWVFWQADWRVIDFAGGGTPVPKKQFYAMAQYTNFIRPGFQIIAVDASNSLAAYSASDQRLVVVAVNWGVATPVDFDLTAFSGLPGTLKVYRTTSDPSINLHPEAGLTIDKLGHLTDTLPVRSVTTYVIDGVKAKLGADTFKGQISARMTPSLCLNVSGDARGPTTAPLVLWSCAGAPENEVFSYDSVSGHISVFSGTQQMCLNVYGGNAVDGAQIGTWACDDEDNERFSLDATTGQIWMWAPQPAKSSFCVDPQNHAVGNGATIFTGACNSRPLPYEQFGFPSL